MFFAEQKMIHICCVVICWPNYSGEKIIADFIFPVYEGHQKRTKREKTGNQLGL